MKDQVSAATSCASLKATPTSSSCQAEKQDWSLPTLNFRRNGKWVELHNRAIICARNLKTAYKELLVVLIEVEAKRIYFQVDSMSLFEYCFDILGLPEHTSYDFIDVIRTSKTIPALAQAIIDGKTTVTKARRVCSVITEKNQTQWIDLVCEQPQKVIRKCVAAANPRAAIEESLTYVSGEVLEIKFAVSEEWAQLLKDAKDLLSTREKRAVSTEEGIFILMAEFKKKNCPVNKAQRAEARRQRMQSSDAVSAAPKAEIEANDAISELGSTRVTRYRPMRVEHAVELRDGNQCTYVNRQGKRCTTKRWLEKHHIVEFAQGGKHTLENLETLCAGHHRMKHRSQH